MIAIIKAHFEWSVMDNKEKAIAILKKGIDKATVKKDELKDLLDSIEVVS